MKVDFFIVGAPKSGTTSLYKYLSEHPQISMSSIKEPNYFSNKSLKNQTLYYDQNIIEDLERYHQLFSNDSIEKKKGEASVSYLFYKDVPKKINDYNPDAKIIIILRNPIERAYSHYLMDYRLGLVNENFNEIIKKKLKHKNAKLYFQQYVELGEYANQIKRYLNEFNINQIMIIDYEDFIKETDLVIDKVHRFLGVNNFVTESNKKYNTFTFSKYKLIRFLYSFVFFRNTIKFILPRKILIILFRLFFTNNNKPEIDEETVEYLKDYFKKDILELNHIIDKDFVKWIK